MLNKTVKYRLIDCHKICCCMGNMGMFFREKRFFLKKDEKKVHFV